MLHASQIGENHGNRSHWLRAAKPRCKFSQDSRLLKKLHATAGSTLVEASPVDSIRGIGLAADDPRAIDRSTWRGRNWLGEVLTAVRERLAPS